jgi:hypothetical protein
MRTPLVTPFPLLSLFGARRASSAWLLPWLGAALLLLACQTEPGPTLPSRLQDFYVRLQYDAAHFPRTGGQWELNNGDPPFYGTAFYVRAGTTQGRADYLDLAAQSRRYALSVVEQAGRDRPYFLANLEEVMMSALGLCEYAAQTGDPSVMPALEDFIDTIDSITLGLGKYLEIQAGKFATSTYGPTAITAAVALLNLQYATYFATPQARERVDFARELVVATKQKAQLGDGYRVKPGEDLLELYPNTMMMLVLTRLYEQTGEADYLQAAERLFEFIKPLRNLGRGGYNSPYSAAEMGARTADYSTLSSQNYLTLALLVLYQNTHDRRYFSEASFVLTFIHEHLYDQAQGRVLHHFIDGRVALPTDPGYFCAGCNLQLLYVLWYARHHITLAE